MTEPIEQIIPRKVPENIQPTLNWFGDILEEMVNFGSNIFMWDLRPEVNGEENVPPTMLFRHFLDLIDTASILTRTGTGDTTKIILRTAFEVSLYLEYIFEADTFNRCMAFIVSDNLTQIKAVKNLHPNAPESKQFYSTIKKEQVLSDLNVSDTKELDDFLAAKEKLFIMPQFNQAYLEYEKLRAQGEKTPKWYRYYNGPRNIENLASHLKHKTMYEIMYRKWSGVVHGSDIVLGKISSRKNEGMVDIVQIRYIKDIQECVRYALILSIRVYKLYVFKRLPDKTPTFITWYKNIKPAFDKIMKTDYIKVV